MRPHNLLKQCAFYLCTGLVAVAFAQAPAKEKHEHHGHDHGDHKHGAGDLRNEMSLSPEEASITQDPKLHWNMESAKPIKYDFRQKVEIKSSQGPAKAPVSVTGTLEILPMSSVRARFVLNATRNDVEVAKKKDPPKPQTTSSCSCQRVPEAKKIEPAKPESKQVPKRPPQMSALFELWSNGTVYRGPGSVGGEIEMMMKSLMPLPEKALQKGQSETVDVDLDQSQGRFPLIGKRVLTYVKDHEVKGTPCALIKSQLEMSGQSDPDGARAGSMEGNMDIKVETEGCFDTKAGRYLESTSTLWLQMNTARMVNGEKRALTVEQTQKTSVHLK